MSHKPQKPMSLLPFKSVMPGVKFPAISDPNILPIMGLLYQFERSQWTDAAEHRAQSFQQLHHLLSIAQAKVHYYHVALGQMGFDPNVPLTEDTWSRVPILTRSMLQEERQRMLSTDIPREYQPFTSIKSSGSTGTPVEVLQPAYKRLTYAATNIFEDIIHGTDFSKKTISIRILKKDTPGPEGRNLPDWGAPTSEMFETGPSAILDAGQDPDVQADWVIKQNPAYLQLYPSNLGALLPILEARGAKLINLHYLRTFGEHLPQHTRDEARRILGVGIVDSYSSQELGYMAIQCPEHEHYHLLQDTCFTEILNNDNRPCAPGEIGRVVVTDLLNPAFPLIRYDIGDYAEMGAPCDCGRGWPVLNGIKGRVRNLVTYPDGSRKWPLTGGSQLKTLAPMRQYQMTQTSPNTLHIKVVGDRVFTKDEIAQMIAKAQEHLGHEFETTFEQVDTITHAANGKFEDFKSEVTPEMIVTAKRLANTGQAV